MSKGVLLHAFGNELVNYYELAELSARLIKKNLKLPVVCVTDRDLNGFDEIIKVDAPMNQLKDVKINGEVTRHKINNDTRFRSYELTPFDQTLILDTDYLVFCNSFLKYFYLDVDFICPYSIKNIATQKVESYLINNTMKQAWATAIYFRKSEYAKSVFDYCNLIRENYRYYSKLLGVRGYIRNDYILSLALHVLNGYNEPKLKMDPINWVSNEIIIKDINVLNRKIKSPGVNLRFNYKEKLIQLTPTNVHLMNKLDILKPEIKEKLIQYANVI